MHAIYPIRRDATLLISPAASVMLAASLAKSWETPQRDRAEARHHRAAHAGAGPLNGAAKASDALSPTLRNYHNETLGIATGPDGQS